MPIFKELKIMSLSQHIQLENTILTYKCIKKEVPKCLLNLFDLVCNQHHHNTRSAISEKMKLPTVRTTHYGLNSIAYKSAKDWNNLQLTLNIEHNNSNITKYTFTRAIKSIFFSL